MKRLKKKEHCFHKIPLWAIILFLIGLIFLAYYDRTELTGKVLFNVQKGTYYEHEAISGTFDLTLNVQEYVPAGSIVRAEIDEQESMLTLEEMITASDAPVQKVDSNFYVENVNISGFGEAYGSEEGITLSLNLSIFDLRVEEAGNYDLVISLVYNDVLILSESAKVKIKSCNPNWKQKNTSCMVDDTKIGYYYDKKECYEETGYDGYLEGRPDNITYECDYCTPNWKQENTSCMINDIKIGYYYDKKECYNETGLDSDLVGKQENITYECDYCEPNWKQYKTECTENDTKTGYYEDKKGCYNETNLSSDLLDKPDNVTLECDYCTPNWKQENTSCLEGDIIIGYYYDKKECYDKTGLDSDLVGKQENITYKALCDYEDNNILGGISDINTEIEDLSLSVANSADLTQPITGTQEIVIKENGSELIEFDFDFSAYELRLADLIIEKQDENATKGFIVVKGIDLFEQNKTKTVWVDRLAHGASVCVEDEEDANAEKINPDCNDTNEALVRCPANFEGYACEFDAGLNKYRISGLRHSAVVERDAFCGDAACNGDESCSICIEDCGACPAPQTTPPASGGGGGGGGGSRCESEWACIEWGVCVEGRQTRTCTDKHNCVKPTDKPLEEQECKMPAAPVPNPEEGIIAHEENEEAEVPQTRLGVVGGVIGVIAVMPLGVKVSVILTFVSLIFVLIAIIIFFILIRGKRS